MSEFSPRLINELMNKCGTVSGRVKVAVALECD